ncbi:hypothetical protein [Nonomuraea sp. KM90]|uniref:hypothetical protein n=1 Tax=Nonomuraea sp. KM90 TaxID=3457428 RepID=UPI003FCEC507
MTTAQIVARLRELAGERPTYVWRELYALANELEQGPWPSPEQKIPAHDLEALVRATQPATTPARVTPLTIARQILRGRR